MALNRKEIQLKSREGAASTFSFTVVFKPEELSAEEPAFVKAEQLQGRILRILVAKDSKMNQTAGVDPSIPVVALTAHALTDEIENYMQKGFTAYLTKPLDLEGLNKTL
ncbi:MAG: hypothetical protein K9K64_13095, partial [Desulfohalobiaceae bacterium]|nr:hypothetical protein [Desulfohalobiaceae bacterium]